MELNGKHLNSYSAQIPPQKRPKNKIMLVVTDISKFKITITQHNNISFSYLT